MRRSRSAAPAHNVDSQFGDEAGVLLGKLLRGYKIGERDLPSAGPEERLFGADRQLTPVPMGGAA